MKNTMKRVIGVIMILVIMMSIGVAAYATNEEEPKKDLIETLVDEGFIYDDYEECWMYIDYTFYGDGEYEYVHGWYDANQNIGVMFSVDYNKFGLVDECCSASFKWNSSYSEIEMIGDFEWSM